MLLMANAVVVVVDHGMNQPNHPMVITGAGGVFHFCFDVVDVCEAFP